jgi:hypothetical protein
MNKYPWIILDSIEIRTEKTTWPWTHNHIKRGENANISGNLQFNPPFWRRYLKIDNIFLSYNFSGVCTSFVF